MLQAMIFPVFALAKELLSEEILHLIQEKLGLRIEIDGQNVIVSSKTESGYDAWRYADIFARNYNALVGMGNVGDMIALYHGTDSRPTGAFLEGLLKDGNATSMIDVCSGCMYDPIYLQGKVDRGELPLTRITCNEIDGALKEQGDRNVAEVRSTNALHEFEETAHYWQELSAHFSQGEFDVSICTGNSLSHLPESAQRKQSIANIALVTKDAFVVDTRNYHWMTTHADSLHASAVSMLQSGEFFGGNKQLFPGSVANFPICIADQSIIFAYVCEGQVDPYALVRFYPITFSEFKNELSEFFGEIDVYVDCKEALDTSEEFLSALDAPRTIQFVCRKPNYEAAKTFLQTKLL